MEIHGMSFSSISLAGREIEVSPSYKRYHTFELGGFQLGRIDEAREKRTPFLFSQFVRLALVSTEETLCEFTNSLVLLLPSYRMIHRSGRHDLKC